MISIVPIVKKEKNHSMRAPMTKSTFSRLKPNVFVPILAPIFLAGNWNRLHFVSMSQELQEHRSNSVLITCILEVEHSPTPLLPLLPSAFLADTHMHFFKSVGDPQQLHGSDITSVLSSGPFVPSSQELFSWCQLDVQQND